MTYTHTYMKMRVCLVYANKCNMELNGSVHNLSWIVIALDWGFSVPALLICDFILGWIILCYGGLSCAL